MTDFIRLVLTFWISTTSIETTSLAIQIINTRIKNEIDVEFLP